MFAIAQTNLQLYNQLGREDRSGAELVRVQAAYELAMELFSAQYRASGKPFLAHLVGTASLLAWMQQPLAVVTAGLVHAAFEFGDFGDGALGCTHARHGRLESIVGRETSELVTAYYRQPRQQSLERLRRGELANFTTRDRAVLLMQLADTVEEYADGGVRYAPGKAQFYQLGGNADVATAIVSAAQQMGLDSVAAGFKEVFAAAERLTLPAELVTQRRRSFSLLPASCRTLPRSRWRQIWRNVQQRIAGPLFSKRDPMDLHLKRATHDSQ